MPDLMRRDEAGASPHGAYRLYLRHMHELSSISRRYVRSIRASKVSPITRISYTIEGNIENISRRHDDRAAHLPSLPSDAALPRRIAAASSAHARQPLRDRHVAADLRCEQNRCDDFGTATPCRHRLQTD